MVDKKYLVIGIIFVAIIIIAILGFYFFIGDKNNPDLCKKISDETLKQKCLLCNDAENPEIPMAIVDCKEVVYTGFASLKKDKSLCDNLIQEYRKNLCLINLENPIIRESKKPIFEPLESGGYRKIS